MIFKSKKAIRTIGASIAIAVAAVIANPAKSQAAPISGGLSFSGSVVPFVNTLGTGTVASGWNTAQSLTFSNIVVASGTTGHNGSFASLADGSAVAMFTPLDINPTIAPATLWTAGIFTFKPTSAILEPIDTANVLELTTTGTISDGTPADTSTGTWIATFTSLGSTYSYNASFQAPAVPEPASVGMLGVAGVGLLARRRRAVK